MCHGKAVEVGPGAHASGHAAARPGACSREQTGRSVWGHTPPGHAHNLLTHPSPCLGPAVQPRALPTWPPPPRGPADPGCPAARAPRPRGWSLQPGPCQRASGSPDPSLSWALVLGLLDRAPGARQEPARALQHRPEPCLRRPAPLGRCLGNGRTWPREASAVPRAGIRLEPGGQAGARADSRAIGAGGRGALSAGAFHWLRKLLQNPA